MRKDREKVRERERERESLKKRDVVRVCETRDLRGSWNLIKVNKKTKIQKIRKKKEIRRKKEKIE